MSAAIRFLSYTLVAIVVVGLLDAALMTTLAHRPAGLIALFVAVAISAAFLFAWRRIDPPLGALLALAAVAAVIAWAVSASGGDPDAIRMTQLDAGRVTLVLTFVLLALLILGTALAPVPFVLKAVALVAECYATIGVYAHAMAGDGFAEALTGNAPYGFDATWLRASVVAAVFLLPAGALASVALSVVSARGGRTRSARLLAFALALGLGAQATGVALASAGWPTFVALENIAGAANEPPVEAVFADDVPANVRAEAARIGPDVGRLFASVANTANEAYPGAMRGAGGTLAAKGGNAVDKALLLRDLLRASDPATPLRFASCVLPSADARTLADAVLASAHPRTPITLERADVLAAQASGPAMQAVLLRWGTTWHGLVSIVREQSAVLSAALKPVDARAYVDPRARVAALVARHYWLERREGAGWTDLDPTLGTAGLGHARCAPAQTADMPAADDFTRVTIRVAIEERRGGTSRERDVLAVRSRVADLAARNLAFLFAEPTGSEGDAAPAAHAAHEPASRLRYTPQLRIGTQTFAGSAFSMEPPPNDDGSAAAIASGVAAAQNALDAKGPDPQASAPGAPDQRVAAQISAAWLRVAIDAPGMPAQAISSTLFDRVGSAARAQKAAGPPVLAAPVYAGRDVAALTAVWNVAIWSGLRAAGVGDDAVPAAKPASADSSVESVITNLGRSHAAFAALRMALFEAATAAPGTYLNAKPSITLLASGGGLDAGTAAIETLADISDDSSEIVDPRGVPPSEAQRATWAVASVLAERLFGGGGRELMADASPPTAAQGNDAVATLAQAGTASGALVTIDRAHPDGPASIGPDENVRSLVAMDVQAGRTVIAPAAMPRGTQFAWFSVDPATGAVRDTMASGRHQTAGEYSGVAKAETKTVPFWRAFGRQIACRVAVGGAILALASGDASAAGSFLSVPAAIAEEEEKWRKVGDAACSAAGGAAGPK